MGECHNWLRSPGWRPLARAAGKSARSEADYVFVPTSFRVCDLVPHLNHLAGKLTGRRTANDVRVGLKLQGRRPGKKAENSHQRQKSTNPVHCYLQRIG